MKIKVVIMSHNTPQTTTSLYYLLSDVFDVTVFNVGSSEGMNPVCPYELYPNIYYTGCWREAMKRFGHYDVLWVIGGDVTAKNSALEYRYAIDTAMPFGLWSPTFDGYCRDVMKRDFANKKVLNVFHLEGIAMAISREMMHQIGRDIPNGNILGWGVDLWMSWESWRSTRRNVLDGRVSMSHPSLCGYSRKEALAEMKDFLEQVVGTHWEEDAKANPEFGEFQVNVRDEIKIGRG